MDAFQHFVTSKPFRYLLALVWIVNGLFCKILGLVPRHEEIVGTILGPVHALVLTSSIGVAELAMAVWVISGWRYRLCAIVQIVVIATMNIIEFIAVPELLLWGRANIIFAAVLVLLIHQSAFGPRASQ